MEKYIARCAESLFAQTYDKIEYVFVNDSSPDNSIDILMRIIDKYPNRKDKVKIINHNRNLGLAATRKTAVLNSTGDYILHVDSDDYVDLNFVSSLCAKAIESSADIVVSETLIHYRHKNILMLSGWNNNPKEYLNGMLTRKKPFNIWGKLIRRSLVIDNNAYAMDGINYGEDYQVIPMLVYLSKTIDEAPSIYHYDRSNMSSYTNNITLVGIQNTIKSQEIVENFFKGKKGINEALLDESRIYTKLTLLSIAKFKYFKEVGLLYNEINYKKFQLKVGHRIILDLIKMKLHWLAYAIIALYDKFYRD